MSRDEHVTVGWEKYDAFAYALLVAGVSRETPAEDPEHPRRRCIRELECSHCGGKVLREQALRIVRFTRLGHKPMTVEERVFGKDSNSGVQTIELFLDGERVTPLERG